MKFSRRLTPFKAISFDLDDTLYSNHPVMQTTAREMEAYFKKELPTLLESSNDIKTVYDINFWSPYKQKVLNVKPDLIHDVTVLRVESYTLGLIELGITEVLAHKTAAKAAAHFDYHRSNFTVPENIHTLLSALAKKYPLIAISNGNVNTQSINIEQYFSATYHAGGQYKQKPATDMFTRALEHLNINANELLHVGDCGKADILGGKIAGCQTAWVSSFNIGKPLSVLPTIELSDVVELHKLL